MPNMFCRLRLVAISICAAGLLGGCGGGDASYNGPPAGENPPSTPTAAQYSVGGTVSGLETGNPLKLRINGSGEVLITADGNYQSAATVPQGSTYSVAIQTQPLWQWCTVANGSGTVAANVSNINVQCQAAMAKVEDVPDTSSTFTSAAGLAADEQGNLWVSDWKQCNIYKISADGSISLVAGPPSGTANPCLESIDQTGALARFNIPVSLAWQAPGTLWVSEGSKTIRSVTPDGSVTTLIGGTGGYKDGTIPQASIGTSMQIAVDSAGSLFFPELFSSTIRAISPPFMGKRMVITIAGAQDEQGNTEGPANDARFGMPWGIGTDAVGNIYVTDAGYQNIRKLDTHGVVSTVAGSATASFADGTGTSAFFNFPTSITADTAGNLYVVDAGNHSIRRITPAGVVRTLAGPETRAIYEAANSFGDLANPSGIQINGQGVIWVVDGSATVRKITPVDPATAPASP